MNDLGVGPADTAHAAAGPGLPALRRALRCGHAPARRGSTRERRPAPLFPGHPHTPHAWRGPVPELSDRPPPGDTSCCRAVPCRTPWPRAGCSGGSVSPVPAALLRVMPSGLCQLMPLAPPPRQPAGWALAVPAHGA